MQVIYINTWIIIHLFNVSPFFQGTRSAGKNRDTITCPPFFKYIADGIGHNRALLLPEAPGGSPLL